MNYFHTFIMDVNKDPKHCFKVVRHGKIIDEMPTIHAGETARGLNILLASIPMTDTLKITGYFRLPNNKGTVRVDADKQANYFNLLFPTMDKGTWECEIVAYDGDSVLSSGKFEGECTESIRYDIIKELPKTLNIDSIIEQFDKYKKMYEEFEQLKKDVQANKENLSNVKVQAHDKHFKFEQLQATDTWDINHNLNKFPSVTVVDSGGNQVVGHITYINNSSITITFAYPFSGIAYLN